MLVQVMRSTWGRNHIPVRVFSFFAELQFQKENIVLQNLMSQTFRTMGLPYNMPFLFHFLAAGACDL
jgi:hypothetical protein